MFGLHKEGLAEHYCLSEVLHWGTTTRVDFVYYLAKKKTQSLAFVFRLGLLNVSLPYVFKSIDDTWII